MNKIRNEKGYAIIVVLFLVMFTLFVGAAFMTASINNAKQEKMVDSNNMAYVAAEMGLEYYISSLQIEESTVANEVYQYILPFIETFNRCGGEINPSLPNCGNVMSIEQIKNEVRSEYIRRMDSFLNSQLHKTNNQIHPSDQSIAYFLNSYSKEVAEDRILIQLDVNGSSLTDPKRILTAWINYRIPILIEGNATPGIPIDEVTNPKDVFTYFIPPDAKRQAPCFKGNCSNDGTYFSFGEVDTNNANKLEGFTWLHRGVFDAKNNMNNLDITLIIESLIFSNNMNNMKGRVVFIGEENKVGTLNIGEIFVDGGSVCINLDGYPTDQLSRLKINVKKNGSGKLMYYSSEQNPTKPDSLNHFEKYSGSLISFVQSCTGLTIYPPEGSESPNYEIILNPNDFDVDINY